MRLSSVQQQAIAETFLATFGKGRILLFGSRVDDAKRGDIDLYVEPDEPASAHERRIAFLARLKRRIGEQKIDLVLASTRERPIDRIAQQQGLVLCENH